MPWGIPKPIALVALVFIGALYAIKWERESTADEKKLNEINRTNAAALPASSHATYTQQEAFKNVFLLLITLFY